MVEEKKAEVVGFELLETLITEDISSWEAVDESNPDCKVYRKVSSDSPLILVQAHCRVRDVPPELVFDAFNDIELRKKWDPVAKELEVVEDFPDKNEVIVYYYIQTPVIASNRDVVAVREFKKDYPAAGQNTVMYHSVEHEKKPERSGFVRGGMKCFSLVIESDGEGGTKYRQFVRMDIGGLIPYFVVNKMSSKMPGKFRDGLIKGCKDLMAANK